jgi:hypothetical protein
LEAVEQLTMLLQMGVSLFAFDFAGCGLSEGDYVTLGHYEKDDLKAVVEFLREDVEVSTIGLWGRSMGAATSLLHGSRDPSIAAMVLDSPFADLEQLAREFVNHFPISYKPGVLVGASLRCVRSSVRKRTGLDMFKLKPIEHANSCFIPAVFVAGSDDKFIGPHHSRAIHDSYAGDKNLVLVEGDHNTRRPAYLRDSICIFFHTRLCVPTGLGQARERPGRSPGLSAEEQAFAASARMGPSGPRIETPHAGRPARGIVSASLAAASGAGAEEAEVAEHGEVAPGAVVPDGGGQRVSLLRPFMAAA